MSEKLLWKDWRIMVINTAAMVQQIQVCILVMLMAFMTSTTRTSPGELLGEWSEVERRQCLGGFLHSAIVTVPHSI